jgi:hypothetical protein
MPIVNIEGLGRIEFPDSMSQEEIDQAIRNEILPMVAQRVPSATVAGLPPSLAAGANPFSKGTGKADGRFSVGDNYTYAVTDLLTKLDRENPVQTVTGVTDTEVIYNSGRMSTDFIGNYIKDDYGRLLTASQFFVPEYSVGKRWTTRFRLTRVRGSSDDVELDFRVAGRESITVPAGTFDAFKVEGNGFVRAAGARWNYVYWIAPEKVRRFIAMEYVNRRRDGRFSMADRYELVSFHQKV